MLTWNYNVTLSSNCVETMNGFVMNHWLNEILSTSPCDLCHTFYLLYTIWAVFDLSFLHATIHRKLYTRVYFRPQRRQWTLRGLIVYKMSRDYNGWLYWSGFQLLTVSTLICWQVVTYNTDCRGWRLCPFCIVLITIGVLRISQIYLNLAMLCL